MKKSELHDKIFDYLDGKLTAAGRAAFENYLRQHPALHKEIEDIRMLDTSMRELTLERPPLNFTDRVMANLDQYPLAQGWSIRNSIFLLAGILVVAVVCSVLLSIGIFDSIQTTIDPNQFGLQPEYFKKSLPAISFDGKLLVNIIIVLNLVLAFLVLDRTVFKPLFQRRMQTGH